MSVDPGPPIQPPQLSPDGRYVWDGSQWQPIADPSEPVHKAVFAAWNSIKVEPADPFAASPQPVQVQAQAPVQVQTPMLVREPAPEVDYAYSVDEPITPLWQRPTRSGMTNYLYAGAGLVVFVIAILLLNSFNFFQFPWLNMASSSSSVQSPQPSPTVDLTRSQFGRADRFLNGSLAPALASLAEAVQLMQTCNGTLSNSCYDAINSTEPQVKNVQSVIDHGTIPPCIASPMKSFRADIVNMDAGMQLALKGYKDNQRGEVGNGISQFARSAQAMAADGRTADQAQKAQCSKDLEGP